MDIAAVRHGVCVQNLCNRRQIAHTVFLADAFIIVFVIRLLFRGTLVQNAAAVAERTGGKVDVPDFAPAERLLQKLAKNGAEDR